MWRVALRALERAVTLGIVIVAAVILVKGYRESKTTGGVAEALVPSEAIDLDLASIIGSKTAPATLVIYSDFECPYCGRFARDTWPSLKQVYVDSGKMSVAFKQFPLPIHEHAMEAATAATCAAGQARFWEFHDELFRNMASLDSNALLGAAQRAGVSVVEWESCRERAQAKTTVVNEIRVAKRLGVRSTPTFFIGRRTGDRLAVAKVISGALPLATFKASIESVLRND